MSARAALLVAGLLLPAVAVPCGGFYAQDVEVAPSQAIVVIHRAGLETYVFRPHFCGTAKDFGVILPIPASLAAAPALADDALFTELDRFTAPETVERCEASGPSCGAAGAGAPGGAVDPGDGVDVVERGRVGIFDYVLLQATSAAAFTDWLDQNGFPRDAGRTAVYQHYVSRGWYFVAFKVTADTALPPAGKKLCGDLGPLSVSFTAAAPVVPARIASVNPGAAGVGPRWRIQVIAAEQVRLAETGAGAVASTYFAGALAPAALASSPALAAASRDGERLTVLDVALPLEVAGDLELAADAISDHRSVVVKAKACGGCVPGQVGAAGGWLAAGGLALLLRRRRPAASRPC